MAESRKDRERDSGPVTHHDAIFQAAYQCQLAFEAISTSDTDSQKIIDRVPLLFSARIRSPTGVLATLDDIRDDYEQFRVWVKNLGVFAPGQSSLDFRLRDTNELHDGFVSLLTSLASELRNCLQLLEVDRPDRRELEDDSSTDSSSEDDPDLQSDQPIPSATKQTADELQIRFRHVSNIIDKLIGLAEIIRTAGHKRRVTKATTFEHWDNGVNLTEQFEQQYLPLVLRHRFKLEEPLLSRFAKALSVRRRRFMYQATHQKRLAYGGESSDTLPVRSTRTKMPISNRTSVEVNPNVGTKIVEAVHHQASVATSAPTKATTFHIPDYKVKAPSRLISASTKAETDQADIPPPPAVDARATHSLCPYCSILIPRTKLSPKPWRSHMIADLQPYICLEPDCKTPDIALESETEWIEHQMWEHGMEWWCDGLEQKHRPLRFLTAEGYVNHLLESHATSHLHSIDTLRATAGRPSLMPFTCCPFCDFLPTEMPSLESGEDAVRVAAKSQKQLQNHILNELLKIFLIALPERDDILNSQAGTDVPLDKRSTLQALSNISLEFVSDGMHSMAENSNILNGALAPLEGDKLTPAAIGQSPRAIDLHSLIDPIVCNSMWRTVWNSPELSNSVRETYTGPKNDSILQTFIRQKVNINSVTDKVSGDVQYAIAVIAMNDSVYTMSSVLLDETYNVGSEVFGHDAILSGYTCGRIGQHNVVVARSHCNRFSPTSNFPSPDSELWIPYLAELKTRFNSLRMMLIVGVGNAVSVHRNAPHMGDVVIGFREPPGPSLVEIGMDWNDNPKILKRHKPHMDALYEDIHTLRNEQKNSEGTKINQLLDRLHKRRPDLAMAFCRPSDNYGTDGSYHTSVAPQSQQVPSSRGGFPVVHYGLVAATAVTVLPEEYLATLAEDFEILAIERDAYGMTDELHSVVISGIAGYGDGDAKVRKNWQGYAAAVASATAKLLMYQIRDHTLNVSLVEADTIQRHVESLAFDGMFEKFNSIADPFPGTCDWFTDSDEYERWSNQDFTLDPPPSAQPRRVLWLCGSRGTGKSTILKYAVNDHYRSFAFGPVIAYFFPTRGSALQQSSLGMYRSLLHQLFDQAPYLKQIVASLLPPNGQYNQPIWDIPTLRRAFSNAILMLRSRSETITCFIDGFCDEVRRESVIEKAARDLTMPLRLCYTSHSDDAAAVDDVVISLDSMREVYVRRVVASFIARPHFFPDDHDEPDRTFDMMPMCKHIVGRLHGNLLWLSVAGLIIDTRVYSRGDFWLQLSCLPKDLPSMFDFLLLDYQNLDHQAIKAAKLIISGGYVEDNIQFRNQLFSAIEANNKQVVEVLIELTGVNINGAEGQQPPPLSQAILFDATQVVELLLSHDQIDVNFGDMAFHTPLMYAVSCMRISIAESLLEHPKTNINARDAENKTALIIAVERMLPGTIKLLLAHPDIDAKVRDETGRDALAYALESKDPEIIDLLLPHPDEDENEQTSWVLHTGYTSNPRVPRE